MIKGKTCYRVHMCSCLKLTWKTEVSFNSLIKRLRFHLHCIRCFITMKDFHFHSGSTVIQESLKVHHLYCLKNKWFLEYLGFDLRNKQRQEGKTRERWDKTDFTFCLNMSALHTDDKMMDESMTPQFWSFKTTNITSSVLFLFHFTDWCPEKFTSPSGN